jgi:hypothetical protein
MWRFACKLITLGLVLALAAPLGAVGANPADEEPVGAPADPGGGPVGDGTPDSCDEPALHAALAGGGLVTFNCGGPKQILILTSQAITLPTTINGGGIITITGGLATRLFDVSPGASLTLKSIVLDSGYSGALDGGAISNDGTLTLDHATIQYSQADENHSGGAIFTTGPVSITESYLHDNSGGNAGAIFAYGAQAVLTIADSTVVNNHATNGAVIGGGKGGALWVGPDATATLIGGLFWLNTAEGKGGAVYNESRLTLDGAEIAGNQTTLDPLAANRGFGGGIATIGPLTVMHSLVINNKSRFGGGLYVGEGAAPIYAEIDNTAIQFNQALYSGGGLHTVAASTNTIDLAIFGSLIEGNVAATGGGISRSNTYMRIYNSSIGSNTATDGAGLLSSASGPSLGAFVNVFDTTIYSNVITGTQGGGVLNQALMYLYNVTLEGNTTGVFNIGSGETMTLHNTVLHNVGLNCDGDGTLPTSQEGNFSSDLSCSLASNGDQQGLGLDTQLGPLMFLVNTARISKFFIPLPNSPLVNTAVPPCSFFDQRGARRLDACDKGAIEYRGVFPMLWLPLVRRSP